MKYGSWEWHRMCGELGQHARNSAWVIAGPEVFVAAGPLYLCMSRETEDEARAQKDADRLDAMFQSCQPHQWWAAAMAGMVRQYAGPERQRVRAKQAQEVRE